MHANARHKPYDLKSLFFNMSVFGYIIFCYFILISSITFVIINLFGIWIVLLYILSELQVIYKMC